MAVLNYAPGIKPRHFAAYLIAVMQPALLTLIGVPQEEQGNITGMLAAMTARLSFRVAIWR